MCIYMYIYLLIYIGGGELYRAVDELRGLSFVVTRSTIFTSTSCICRALPIKKTQIRIAHVQIFRHLCIYSCIQDCGT